MRYMYLSIEITNLQVQNTLPNNYKRWYLRVIKSLACYFASLRIVISKAIIYFFLSDIKIIVQYCTILPKGYLARKFTSNVRISKLATVYIFQNWLTFSKIENHINLFSSLTTRKNSHNKILCGREKNTAAKQTTRFSKCLVRGKTKVTNFQIFVHWRAQLFFMEGRDINFKKILLVIEKKP